MTPTLDLSEAEAVRFKTDTRCYICKGQGHNKVVSYRYTHSEHRMVTCSKCNGSGNVSLSEWVTLVDTLPTQECVRCEGTDEAGISVHPSEGGYRCPYCKAGVVSLGSGDVVTITGPCPECSHIEIGPVTGSPHITMQKLCVWCDDSGSVPLGVGTITNIVQVADRSAPGTTPGATFEYRVTLTDVERTTDA